MTPLLEQDLITTRSELNALQPEWNDLLQRSTSNNVFLTWEWISSWWDWLSGDLQPWVFTLRQPSTGRLLGLAPLAQGQYTSRRGLRYNVLTFIGSHKVAPDHLSFIIDSDEEQTVAPALIKGLVSLTGQRDILSLSGLASESAAAWILQGRSWYRQRSHEVCPYISLPEDWDSYKKSLSRKFRANLRSSARRLEGLYPGAVCFHQVTSEKELGDALPTLFRLHMEVRQAQGDVGHFADLHVREFHRQVATLFLKNGWLRFYRLRVKDEDVALSYNFYYNRVLSGYQMGYKRAWRKHSPGSQIISHAIHQAIEERAYEFDFLRGAEPYKFKWTNRVRKDLTVEFSSSIVRRFHNLYLDFDSRIRAIRRKLFNR